MRHIDCPRCKTLHCWGSVDSHFQDGAGRVSLLVLPIKHANTSVMNICNPWPLRLPKMQDQKSLTLHWRSFPGWCRECLSSFFDYKGGHYIQKEHQGTIINILRLIVGYLNATIHRTTRNAELEIGPTGSSKTRRNPRVDRNGAGFWLPRSCRLGFWTVMEMNRTIFPVQTQTTGGLPGPVANTTLDHSLQVHLQTRSITATE